MQVLPQEQDTDRNQQTATYTVRPSLAPQMLHCRVAGVASLISMRQPASLRASLSAGSQHLLPRLGESLDHLKPLGAFAPIATSQFHVDGLCSWDVASSERLHQGH
jgi:hypothetical protein